MFTLEIAIAVALAAASVIVGLAGARILSRCAMACALSNYANALTWDHAPKWQTLTLVAVSTLLLLRAIHIAATRQPPVDNGCEADHG